MNKSFIGQLHPPTTLSQSALWFIFYQEQLLVISNNNEATSIEIPEMMDVRTLGIELHAQHYLGSYENKHCFTAEVTHLNPLLNKLCFRPLRQVYETLGDEELLQIACRAKQILLWDKSTQFCGYCGQPTEKSLTERAKSCSSCHALFYPQISPVIMVLISRGDQLLLARSPHFKPGMYSTLAGFIEPGETAEQAVRREVFEEVGLSIDNIQYFGSQPWPFPSNLMLGYTAHYKSAEICIDPIEIEDAQWFSKENLPLLPRVGSLSRQLIELFLLEKRSLLTKEQ